MCLINDPDTLLEQARKIAFSIPNPCEGSRGHLAEIQVNDYQTDLEYIRKDPTNILLLEEGGTYYCMKDLIEDLQVFIKDNKDRSS